jgi:hypothetical protein
MRQMLGIAQAGAIGRPPNRVDRLVLEQQQFVADRSIGTLPRHQIFLHRERVAVRDTPDPPPL